MTEDRTKPKGPLLIASDLSVRADRAFDRAVALAIEREWSLTVAHVVDEELPAAVADRRKQEAESVLRAQIAATPTAAKLNIDVKVTFGRDFSSIVHVAEQSDARAIVLGTTRYEGMAELFRGTTAERVIRAANLPCLVVKQRVLGPYRRALIGIDFSVYSHRAIEAAAELLPNCKLTLVHAYDVPYRGFLLGGARELNKRQERQFLQLVEDEFSAFLAPLGDEVHRLDRIIQEGPARQVLYETIKSLQADVVVIGTHGRTGAAHFFLGSVAEDLLRDAPCDVLAVKAW